MVAPKISGRIKGLNVDLGDTVRRGQVVAKLDDDEYVQAIILAKAGHLGKLARLEVSKAQLKRAKASLETARIRIGYTKVTADWTGGDDSRVVADRYVDEGETVSANAPLLSIVEVDPIIGVIFVTEKDYIHLKRGQAAMLTTDAYSRQAV